MDQNTQHVRDFLTSMQLIREALGDLVRHLYQRAQVKTVRTYYPEASLSSDFGVSVELHNGAMVDFWIEMSPDDTSWQMDYSVLRHDPDEDGSHAVVSFPPEIIRSVLDMPKTLLAAVQSLQQASSGEALYR